MDILFATLAIAVIIVLLHAITSLADSWIGMLFLSILVVVAINYAARDFDNSIAVAAVEEARRRHPGLNCSYLAFSSPIEINCYDGNVVVAKYEVSQ